MLEEENKKFFTDFDGRFVARLSSVVPVRRTEVPSETTGISAKYECRIKAEYQKDLMGLLEEGMLLAVRNFKASRHGGKRFTLLEISRIGPEHYGLKGLSDHAYYPYQFEIIQQSVGDWDTDDKSTMMIQLGTIPLNYDLIIDENGEAEYTKGFTYPVIAESVRVLNKETIHQMYNKTILERIGHPWEKIKTSPFAHEDPRLGTIKMFESEEERIPIYVDFERLVRYHFGIFGFTGSGKSNLLSNILRRLVYHTKDAKIVIFDISIEYPFLLQDVFTDKSINSKIITEVPVEDPKKFQKIIVTPRGFEKTDVTANLERILKQGKVGHYEEAGEGTLTYEDILNQIKLLAKDDEKKAVNLNAIKRIERRVRDWTREKRVERSTVVTEEFVDYLHKEAQDAVEKFKVWKSSALAAWASTLDELKSQLEVKEEPKDENSFTIERLLDLLRGNTRLLCLSLAEPAVIKQLAITLTSQMLRQRKREFQVDPQILFVFDEAQEFIPAYDKARGIERECTEHIEKLMRQGRKYGLGACLATQRIAYLNTNALQQLHTYFVGPLPRPYDRSLVSNTFTIDQGILEKTLEFAPGEWLLSSYIATGIENVPIFIKADNAESEINSFLQKLALARPVAELQME